MIPLSKPPKVIEENDTKGIFEIEALYPGYGVTIGNSLRRVLLSSLEGAAVTQVKIKGAPHEFSTIPGMLQDVLSLLLNIKKMRFQMFSQDPQTATLRVKGEREVRGSDFKLPPELALANPDIPLATLTAKQAELEMEIQVRKGVGYVRSEDLQEAKAEVGTMFLDAIFSPVRQVSWKVEHMRVGERTDFDRLRLEIETDGTMHPRDALANASEILAKQFELLSQGLTSRESARETGEKEKAEKKGNGSLKTVKTKKKR